MPKDVIRPASQRKDFNIGGVEGGGPGVFLRVYDGDELLGESTVKRNSEKRIATDLRVDRVQADPNERHFAYARTPILVAEGGEE